MRNKIVIAAVVLALAFGGYGGWYWWTALRVLEREITISQKDQQRRYVYAVAGDATEIEDEVGAFGTMLAVAFLMLGAGLLVATFFQVKFGKLMFERADDLANLVSNRAGIDIDMIVYTSELPEQCLGDFPVGRNDDLSSFGIHHIQGDFFPQKDVRQRFR